MPLAPLPARRALPALVIHADWGSHPGKRWMARAALESDAYRAHAPEPVGDPATLLARLRGAAPEHDAVFLGLDLPLGLPAAYAERAGVADFPSLLPRLGEGLWARFYDAAAHPDEVSLHRPFYPLRRVPGVSRAHLLAGLGLEDPRDLLRACDLAHEGRRAATSMFWTFGPQQVGKATILGWRDVLAPALRARTPDLALWPFDGRLDALLGSGRVVVAEVYPTECYGHLGAGFKVRKIGERWGKRERAARLLNGPPLLGWAEAAGVRLAPELRAAITDGFGMMADGEDRFDCTAGLFGMLNVVLGLRPAGESPEGPLRRVEGWMLGRAGAAEGAPPIRFPAPPDVYPQRSVDALPLVAEERGPYDAGGGEDR